MTNTSEPVPTGVPRTLRVGLGLWVALGVFLLVRAAISWTDLGALRGGLVDTRGLAPERAEQLAREFLVVNTILAVVLAAGYAGLAWSVLRRHSWARIAVSLLAVAHVLLLLLSGAWSASNLIVLVLAVLAWACFWRRETSEWLAGDR
ncbi:hypothetical protein SAMN04487820_102218 [Actinopolyspora mzabensis]|uniref:Uncharacterized protein n=1 Tax=Actinopolyspora mzabensis TaxID=995066 RepID=A0A1G8WT95_ACTMZ|nr:hypothetical protein [Actinopolyspora mzabensis]SDJ81568.1 hypothetical protein SAMN04487820_102218 [Actinopolyspora mzabensis]